MNPEDAKKLIGKKLNTSLKKINPFMGIFKLKENFMKALIIGYGSIGQRHHQI